VKIWDSSVETPKHMKRFDFSHFRPALRRAVIKKSA
jgi:hypothetical protein